MLQHVAAMIDGLRSLGHVGMLGHVIFLFFATILLVLSSLTALAAGWGRRILLYFISKL